MADVADYTQAVNVTGGSVAITGTATVQITGTPTVSISGTPTVNVGNTPAVTISSGTVNATISGTPNINIQSQSITIQVNQPPTALSDISWTVDATKTTGVVPAGTHALLVILGVGAPPTGSVTVTGHTSGAIYFPNDNRVTSGFAYTGDFILVPVDSSHDTQFDIQILGVASNPTTLKIAAILDTASVIVSTRPTSPLYIATPAGNPIAVKGIGVAGAANNNQFAVADVAQPYDVIGVSAPAAGSQASVVLAATPGKTYTAARLAASTGNGGTTVQQAAAQLKDGTTLMCSMDVYLPGTTGSNVGFNESGLAYRGTTGNSMTFQITAGTTGVSQTVNIGAYLA